MTLLSSLLTVLVGLVFAIVSIFFGIYLATRSQKTEADEEPVELGATITEITMGIIKPLKRYVLHNSSYLIIIPMGGAGLALTAIFFGTAWSFLDLLEKPELLYDIPYFAATWMQLGTFFLSLFLFAAWVLWAWAFKPWMAYGLIKMGLKRGANAINLNQQLSTRGKVHAATEEINGALTSQGIDRMACKRSGIMVDGIPVYVTYGDELFTVPPKEGEAATALVEEGVRTRTMVETLVENGGGDVEIPVGMRTVRLSDFFNFKKGMDSGVATERVAQERERKLVKKLGNPFNTAWQAVIFLGAILGFLVGIYMIYYLFIDTGSAPDAMGKAAGTALITRYNGKRD